MVDDDTINNFLQWSPGPETGQALELVKTGHTPEHVFKSGFVGLIVGNELNRGGALRLVLHLMSQSLDRHLFIVAHIHNFAHGGGG